MVSTRGLVEATRPPRELSANADQINGTSPVASVVCGTGLVAFVHEDGSVRVAPRSGPVVVAHNPTGIDRLVLCKRQ